MSDERKSNLVKNITELVNSFVAAERAELDEGIQDAVYSMLTAFDALGDLADLVESARSSVEDAKECLRDLDG